jgi:hypothetical protein
MAAGFRSPFFRWIGGISAPGGSGPEPPTPGPELCPCPDYGHDSTLTNQFTTETTLTNQFTGVQTLTSQWKRGTCNG